jgi:hypothetical protein
VVHIITTIPWDPVECLQVSIFTSKQTNKRRILGSHGGEYEGGCLLGCSAIVALMMEAARTSETSVNFYQTTRRYIPDDSHLKSNKLQHDNNKRKELHTLKKGNC